MLSVLLYGSGCWIPLRKDLKKLNHTPQMCPHSVGHHQAEAVGGTYRICNGERAVGRCKDRDKACEKTSRMAWTLGKDARSPSPQDLPVWMAT